MVDNAISVICILLVFALFLFLFYIAIRFFEDEVIIGGCVASLLALVCISVVGYFCFASSEPAETIEIDGYTYVLEEEPPKEVIEHNGHRYVLEENANA